MLLEGSELTKEDRESYLYDDFEHFCQNKGETIHDICPVCQAHQQHVEHQDEHVQNAVEFQGRLNKGQGNNARVTGAASYGGAHNRVGNTNLAQERQIKCYNYNDLVYDKVGPSYDLNILSEVHDHENYQDVVCKLYGVHEMHDHVQPNCVVDSNAECTSDSNMILYDQYVKDNAESVVHNIVSSVPHDVPLMIINEMHEQTAQFTEMHDAHTVVHACCLELEAELSKLN
nr:integrase, catalytic region, zinc finger, CCHC-type, peptidase aspartic, catalytic [Tanacetum cinerariifolium]